MLNALHLLNFKSARDLSIELKPLTVLAGLNGSGKSSVLQAIALAKQSLEDGAGAKGLQLRGRLVRLGRSEDVHSEGADTGALEITLKTDRGTTVLAAKALPKADTLPMEIRGVEHAAYACLRLGFQFIQADRLTPATQYLQASTPDQESGWLGCSGEFTVDFLQRNDGLRVSPARLCTSDMLGIDPVLLEVVAPTTTLPDQTAAWLQLLSPGVRLRATSVDLADATSLRYQYTGPGLDSPSREHRPSNVGFGLTYCLPIVVACLTAPSGAVLLLENPEAHLHPRGQAALGQLLAKCSADGVQIVVETHSDHLLNGIRVGVKLGSIKADDVALHYFTRNVNSGESSIESPKLLPDGQLDSWPEGFFDQWDRSLDVLLD